MKPMRRFLAAAVLLLALSACEMKAELVVHKDGSGTMTYVVSLDKKFLNAVKGDPFAKARRHAELMTFPVRTKSFETKKEKGIRATFAFKDLGDLQRKLHSLDTSEDGSGAFVFSKLAVVNEDHDWRLRGTSGDPKIGLGESPVNLAQLEKQFDIRFVATLPGHRKETDAPNVKVVRKDDSTRFEWQVPPGKGDLNLFATTSTWRFPWLLAAAAAFGAIVLSVGTWWLRRRRSGHSPRSRAGRPLVGSPL